MTAAMPRFPLDGLRQYTRRGLVRSRAHPSLGLAIYNYTETAQYTKAWDEVTRSCRALVLDAEGTVVARSFPKFHNLSEGLHTATDAFEVFEKLDGSLILLFHYRGEWRVASRGSFDSEQAAEARRMMADMYDPSGLDPALCYSFEILYPENRIVVDYGGRRELVFLAAFDRRGEEAWPVQAVIGAGFRCARRFDHLRDVQAIKRLAWKNAEGCVVRFSNGQRAKVKFDEYCRLHKVVSGLNEATVWEWFRAGSTPAEVVGSVPDEWHAWLDCTMEKLRAAYDTREAAVRARLREVQPLGSRKEQALALRGDPLGKLVFLALDGRDLRDAICRDIKPAQASSAGPPRAGRQGPLVQGPGRILVLCGLSGAGKSSWAREHVAASAGAAVVVSRDGLRRMLFGYGPGPMAGHYSAPDLGHREELVTAAQRAAMRAALACGKEVVVDDTNLSLRTINNFLRHFPDVEVAFRLFEADAEQAAARDTLRAEPVGQAVIAAQAAKLRMLKRTFGFAARPAPAPLPAGPAGLPTAFVFDMDGTLAINAGRHPFDWTRVHEDLLDPAVHQVLCAVRAAGHRIVVCTARDGSCEQASRDWLARHGVTPDAFYIRPAGDGRPDHAVKEGFWREVCGSHHVLALIDDRDSVVRHARSLGLKVLQAAAGDF